MPGQELLFHYFNWHHALKQIMASLEGIVSTKRNTHRPILKNSSFNGFVMTLFINHWTVVRLHGEVQNITKSNHYRNNKNFRTPTALIFCHWNHNAPKNQFLFSSSFDLTLSSAMFFSLHLCFSFKNWNIIPLYSILLQKKSMILFLLIFSVSLYFHL